MCKCAQVTVPDSMRLVSSALRGTMADISTNRGVQRMKLLYIAPACKIILFNNTVFTEKDVDCVRCSHVCSFRELYYPSYKREAEVCCECV